MRMEKQKIFLSLFFLFVFLSKNFSQGLSFHANDELISKRTAYTVFGNKSLHFDDFLEVSFEMSIHDINTFGYVCYIKNKTDETSYALTINTEHDTVYLKLSLVGKYSLLQVPLDAKSVGYKKWLHIELIFDGQKKEIALTVNKKTSCIKENEVKNNYSPVIIFGKHDSYVDVPKIAIRNLSIEGKNKSLNFQLNESAGNEAFDSKGKKYGIIENPEWLINDSYYWKLRCEKNFENPAVINFDTIRQQFILLDKDSAFTFSLNNNRLFLANYAHNHSLDTRLGCSFIDDKENKLYIYEVNNLPFNSISVSVLDLLTGKWEDGATHQLPQQRHHHSSFFNAETKRFTIFGGFGNQRYSNSFDTYYIDQNQWITENFSGNVIHPRFYSGQAKINDHQSILFGGIGNQTGDQIVGRSYSYDCYLIDYEGKNIEKLWEIPLSSTGLVSVRNMVLADDSASFYTLCYPEYIPATSLKLYRFSIENGNYEISGDSIPFTSERIESNANLYYNNQTREFYCTTQVFSPNGSSVIKIYSLDSPPSTRKDISPAKKNTRWKKAAYLGILILLLAIGFRFCLSCKKKIKTPNKRIQDKIKELELTPDPQKANSIYVFGAFTVIDYRNKDVSYLFSPKLKQLFLYILFAGMENEKGIDSQTIHATIWPDKTAENAKNLKGVALNQIRKILTDLDGIELVFRDGYFKFELTGNLYVDYLEFIELINKEKALLQEDTIRRITEITTRGMFLKSIEFPEMLRIKQVLKNKIKNLLFPEIVSLYRENKYTQAIYLAKTLNRIDEKDENVFKYEIESYIKSGLTDLAKKRYNNFLYNLTTDRQSNLPASFIEYIDNKSIRIK
jgi:two-component SAPR family response regulator